MNKSLIEIFLAPAIGATISFLFSLLVIYINNWLKTDWREKLKVITGYTTGQINEYELISLFHLLIDKSKIVYNSYWRKNYLLFKRLQKLQKFVMNIQRRVKLNKNYIFNYNFVLDIKKMETNEFLNFLDCVDSFSSDDIINRIRSVEISYFVKINNRSEMSTFVANGTEHKEFNIPNSENLFIFYSTKRKIKKIMTSFSSTMLNTFKGDKHIS
jgi:hypothetical protein